MDFLVAILITLGAFAMIFGIVYLFSRERMAMIARGMDPKEFRKRSPSYWGLKLGLLLSGAGVGLLLAFLCDRYLLHTHSNPAIYFSLIAIGGGLGLIASYKIEKKELLNKEQDL